MTMGDTEIVDNAQAGSLSEYENPCSHSIFLLCRSEFASALNSISFCLDVSWLKIKPHVVGTHEAVQMVKF